MISQKTIQLLASKWQTTELNVVREFIQHRFLNYLYQQAEADRILFKGGTALRILYQSPRFSEDLDFSSFNLKFENWEDSIARVLVEMEREKLSLSIKESKETTGGGIFDFGFNIFDMKPTLKLNIVSKPMARGELILVHTPLTEPYSVYSLNSNDLVKEKLQALLSRSKIRDYFDLYYILRARLAIKKVVENKKELLIKVGEFKNNFKELETLLPKSYFPLLKNFKEILLKELERL